MIVNIDCTPTSSKRSFSILTPNHRFLHILKLKPSVENGPNPNIKESLCIHNYLNEELELLCDVWCVITFFRFTTQNNRSHVRTKKIFQRAVDTRGKSDEAHWWRTWIHGETALGLGCHIVGCQCSEGATSAASVTSVVIVVLTNLRDQSGPTLRNIFSSVNKLRHFHSLSFASLSPLPLPQLCCGFVSFFSSGFDRPPRYATHQKRI